MADDSKTPEEPFLQRWARRKAEAATAETPDAAPEIETAAADNPPPAPARADTETPEIDPDTLPDIDSLDKSSDFSVFMQDGVPEPLRTRALQRLWQVDPAFSHLDGLVEYGDDFTDVGVNAGVVSTIYKVGKGMLSGDDDEAEPEATVAAVEESADDDIIDHTPKRDTAVPDTTGDNTDAKDETG